MLALNGITEKQMGKKIPMWQILLVIILGLGIIMYSIFFSYGELHMPLLCAAVIAAIVGVINKWKWSYIERGILSGIDRSMQACLILLLVGIIVSTWKAGGVIPSMIYYGLNIINPSYFLVTVCLLCSFVSLCIGSSYTTAGTIGVAMIGVSIGIGIDPAMTAGAVVSGSYFGDKMSPLSDTTNLAPATAGTDVFTHIRHMIYTVTPSYIIALAAFYILGRNASESAVSMGLSEILQEEIQNEFVVSPLLIIPVLLLIVAVAFKVPVLPAMIIGIVSGLICMGAVQGIPLVDFFSIMHYGYEASSTAILTDAYTVADIIGGGGFNYMLWTVSIVLCSMSFSGVLESTGMMASLAETILKAAKNDGLLVLITICSCIFINIIAADQYLAIILPGRMYKQAFEDRRLKNKNLSRCLEDSATLTSPLVPWNVCGATMSGFLGVPTLAYLPYAVLNYVNPIVSIIYGFTGFTMEKMTDEEYEKVLEQRELDAAMAERALAEA
ncbi:MAG: Na+/H+ antiporter NhaC [Peptostreptococcaceae bacterium]|nr:Na+/H+ antiporter NhaC [Peptostreptococcaceae bacterium]